MQDRQKIVSVLSAPRSIGETRESASAFSATHLVAVFDAEIATLASIDLETLRLRLEACKALAKLDMDRAAARAKLETMEKLASDLTQRIDVLTAGGPPAERLSAVQRERLVLQQAAATSTSIASQTEQRARQLQSLERSLRASELGEVCPTCARPFQTGEAEKTLQALTEQIRLLETEIAAERSTAQRLETQAAQLGATEISLTKENDEYLNLLGRIDNGRGMIESQQRDLASIELELGRQLRAAQRHDLPDKAEIDRLDNELRIAEAECSRRPRLEVSREQLVASIARQEAIDAYLVTLGPIAYDLDAHRRDHAAWSIARDAVARIEALQTHVARRPEREATVQQTALVL